MAHELYAAVVSPHGPAGQQQRIHMYRKQATIILRVCCTVLPSMINISVNFELSGSLGDHCSLKSRHGSDHIDQRYMQRAASQPCGTLIEIIIIRVLVLASWHRTTSTTFFSDDHKQQQQHG
jgi:hypothetical protein